MEPTTCSLSLTGIAVFLFLPCRKIRLLVVAGLLCLTQIDGSMPLNWMVLKDDDCLVNYLQLTSKIRDGLIYVHMSRTSKLTSTRHPLV
jgi:hypothetical protein